MNRDAALRKVLACLRLAKSNNPNEAAAALRHAKALMREYGLSEDDALAAEIHCAEAVTTCRASAPPTSLAVLVNMVARGYTCEPLLTFIPGRGMRVEFYGAGVDAKVAAYAFIVLFRQLDKARLAHIRRIRKRGNRAARGEAFALGWVAAVLALFPAAELSDDRRRALAAAVRRAAPTAENSPSRDLTKRGEVRDSDYGRGLQAGRGAQLHQGIEGDAQRRIGQG